MSRVSPERVILGLLEVQSCHGYQLLEHFQDPARLGHIWKLSTSRLYALLKRLEQQLLIDGREENTDNAPMRTVYWLTETGRSALYEWLDNPAPSASTRNIRTEFLSRVYIASVLKRPTTPIIAAQRDTCINKIARLESQFASHEQHIGALAVRLKINEMQVIVDWLRTCENVFSSAYD